MRFKEFDLCEAAQVAGAVEVLYTLPKGAKAYLTDDHDVDRRVRCTGERPSCQACAKRGSSCQYGLKLTWNALSRGIAHGRQGLWSKTKKSAMTSLKIQQTQTAALHLGSCCPYFINTSYDTFRGVDLIDDSCDIPATLSIPASLNIGPLNSEERSMLAYFVDEVCPSCTLSPWYNPYINYIAPLAFESAATRHTILGVAAMELHWRCGDARYRNVCVNHKIKALRALQRDIAAVGLSGCTRESTYQIAASTLMLCFLEIAEGSYSSWTTHMNGARQISDMLLAVGIDLDHGFKKFYLMYFVAHEVMGHTAWTGATLFDPEHWFVGDDDQEIDPLMGCSRGLMHCIASISELAKGDAKASDQLFTPTFKSKRDDLERELHSLHQISHVSVEGGQLETFAEIKRICALLYLHSRLDGLQPENLSILRLSQKSMGLLRALPARSTLLWPIFIIGTMGAPNEEDRRHLLDVLQELLTKRPLSSTTKVRSVIINVWKDRDIGRYRRWKATRSRLSLA